MWYAYSSLSDARTRQAFLRTLRSVVDYRGQAVSALNKLHVAAGLPTMMIWGDHDRIIPVAHGYAAHDALEGSRLEVLEGVGHFPHAEAPAAVAEILEDFITSDGAPGDRPLESSRLGSSFARSSIEIPLPVVGRQDFVHIHVDAAEQRAGVRRAVDYFLVEHRHGLACPRATTTLFATPSGAPRSLSFR